MTKTLNRNCIIIAGMHRSGTSALTRVLSLLGGTLPKTLMPPSATNETGYWESQRLALFNDEILESAGSTWDDWASGAPDWDTSPAMGGFGRRALELYLEEFGDANLTVLKDPRMCRLLPFWIPVLKDANINPYVVLPIRNPKEVAASISKRNGTDIYYNHLLWLRHVLEAEAGSRGLARAFVTYDDLLENYSTVVSATESRLGLKWPRRSARVSEEIEAYLSDQYRNERLSKKLVSGDLSSSDWLNRTYEIMQKWAEVGEDDADYAALDDMLNDMNVSAQRFGRVIYRGKLVTAEVHALKSEVIAAEALHLDKLSHLENQHSAAIKESQDLISLAAQDNAVLSQRIEKADKLVEETQAQLETLLNETAQLRSDLAKAHQETEQLTIRLQDTENAALETQAQLQNHAAELVKDFEERLALADQDKAGLMKISKASQDTAENEASQLRLDLAKAEKLNADLTKGFRDTFALAEQDNETLTDRLKEAEAALETLEQNRRSQMFEMNQIRSSLAQKKAEADDYHFEIKRYHAEKSELTNSIAGLKSEISASKAQGSKLASQIQNIVTAMDNQAGLPLLPKRFKRARNQKILSAAGVVNPEWYLNANPDVSALGVDAILHYVTHGASEGRSPNPEHDAIKNNREDA